MPMPNSSRRPSVLTPTQATFNPKPPPPDPSGHLKKSAIAREINIALHIFVV